MPMLSSVPAAAAAQATGPGEEMNAREGSVSAQNGGDTQSAWTRPFHSFLAAPPKPAARSAAQKSTGDSALPQAPGLGATGRPRPKFVSASPSSISAAFAAPLPAVPPALSVSGAAMAVTADAHAPASPLTDEQQAGVVTPAETDPANQTASGVPVPEVPGAIGAHDAPPALSPAPTANHQTSTPPVTIATAVVLGSASAPRSLSLPEIPQATPSHAGAISSAGAPSSPATPVSAKTPPTMPAPLERTIPFVETHSDPATAVSAGSDASARPVSPVNHVLNAALGSDKTLQDVMKPPSDRQAVTDIQANRRTGAPAPASALNAAVQNAVSQNASAAGFDLEGTPLPAVQTSPAGKNAIASQAAHDEIPKLDPSLQTPIQTSASAPVQVGKGQQTAQDSATPSQSDAQPSGQQPSGQQPSGQQTSGRQSSDGRSSDPGPTAHDAAAASTPPAFAPARADGVTAAATVPSPAAAPVTPPAAAPGTLLRGATPAERVQIVNQVAQQIQALHSANAPQPRTVTMQLHPDQWGPVTISVTTHGAAGEPGTVSALVTTAHGDAQALLRQNSQDLKDALSSAGLRLDKLDIQTQTVLASTGSHGADAHQQGQSDSQSGRWAGTQHGASPQTGSQGGQQGFPSGQGRSQQQASMDADLDVAPLNGAHIGTRNAASPRTGTIDLHA